MMKMRIGLKTVATVVATGVLTSACQPDLPQMDPEVHAAEIEAWQTRRAEGLKAPTGWLSVIGLDWLEPGENTFGADPSNDVVFPDIEGVPARAGSFFLENGQVRMDVAQQVIERAVENVKRSAWNRWFRRKWYRAEALRKKRWARRSGGMSW